MTSTDTLSPQERLDAAMGRWEQLNQGVLPANIKGFELPPDLHTAAMVDALAGLLIEKGLVDQQELLDTKTERVAVLVETLADQAEQFKARSGLVSPDGRPL